MEFTKNNEGFKNKIFAELWLDSWFITSKTKLHGKIHFSYIVYNAPPAQKY